MKLGDLQKIDVSGTIFGLVSEHTFACYECAMLTVDPLQHIAWHAKYNTKLRMLARYIGAESPDIWVHEGVDPRQPEGWSKE